MKISTCENCKHYRQRYIKLPKGFKDVYCGHCVKKIKSIKSDELSCEKFDQKEDFIKQSKQNVEKVIYEINEKLKKILELFEN